MREQRVGFRDAAGKLSITEDKLVREIVSVAENELAFWSRDGDPLTDRSPDGVERITGYLTYLWDGSVPTMPKKGGGRRDFHPSRDAWSAVFVCYCVTYAFEKLFGRVDDRAAFRERVPLSRELMHFQYAKAALMKRDAGARGRREARGHYWAYDTGIAVEPGDIVLKDRRRLEPGMANLQFGDLRRLAWQSTHADIVTRVEGDTAILVGGNLGDSVKETRYPLKGGLIDRRQRRNAANRVFCELRLVPQTDEVTSTGKVHPVSAKSVKQKAAIAASDGERRVVILVPGTTDPFNTNPESESGEDYWKEGTFLSSLRQLCNLPRCELIPDFTWSGDNNLEERKKAGESLWEFVKDLLHIDRQDQREEPTSLHLIGHSHGGNVINEFTKASASEMPDDWRIGSITYLSTPFIPAHAPVLTRFADDAVVLNVANTYDLTQRVIADFTLAHGPPVRNLFIDSGLEAAVENFVWPPAIERLKYDQVGFIRDSTEGLPLWEEWITFFDGIPRILRAFDLFITRLEAENDQLLERRVVDMVRILNVALEVWSLSSSNRLKQRVDRWHRASTLGRVWDHFNLPKFYYDVRYHLQEVLRSLNAFLGTRVEPVDNPLLVTIAGLVINSTKLFADARAHPGHLFRLDGGENRIRIVDIPIHRHDPYDATGLRSRYEAFAGILEALQRQSIGSDEEERKRLLREALLMIVAQMDFERPLESMRKNVVWWLRLIDFVLQLGDGQLGTLMKDLEATIETLTKELSSRRLHLLGDHKKIVEIARSDTVVKPTYVDPHAQGLGDIVRYCIHPAHNLSRSTLFPEVASALRGALR